MKKTITLVIIASLLLSMGMAQRPRPKVDIRSYPESRYQLFVRNKPYVIRGVCYNPVPIGKNHEYDLFSDPNKPWLIDGKLMQEMGINTVRFYQVGENPEQVRQVIRDLYELYGIRSILGHWLGFWDFPCPRYGDADYRNKLKQEVLEMVRLYKDEEGLLMWVLGNENNYAFSGRVNPWSTDEIETEPCPVKQREMRAQLYYSLVNEIAQEIKQIDSDHPVALGNGELHGLETADALCPDIDIVGVVIYRGKTFGNLFNAMKMTFDRPILFIEFGADAYDAYRKREDQNMQAYFLEHQWRQIQRNLYAHKDGAGNCLGGTMFEWTDEWWKHQPYAPDSWREHLTGAGWSNPSYYFDAPAENNLNMNEEWFGIVAIFPELEDGINKRAPRKAYYVLRQLWQEPESNELIIKGLQWH